MIPRYSKRTCTPATLRAWGQVLPQLHQTVGKNVPMDGECPVDLLSAIDQYVL